MSKSNCKDATLNSFKAANGGGGCYSGASWRPNSVEHVLESFAAGDLPIIAEIACAHCGADRLDPDPDDPCIICGRLQPLELSSDDADVAAFARISKVD